MLPKLRIRQKAKAIFLKDPIRPNKEVIISPDIDLAQAFVAEKVMHIVLCNQNQ